MTEIIQDSMKVAFSLKAAVAIIFAIILATWTLSLELTKINNTLSGIVERVSTIESNRYRISDASEQALRMAIENPNMRIPDPRNTANIIVVYNANAKVKP